MQVTHLWQFNSEVKARFLFIVDKFDLDSNHAFYYTSQSFIQNRCFGKFNLNFKASIESHQFQFLYSQNIISLNPK
jgi:hypothetical protein